MKCLMLVLALFALSGCEKDDPVIDAKYLAVNECKYTGESFENVEHVWRSVGRGGSYEEVTKRYYLYICQPGNQKTLSLVRLVLDKE